MSEPIKRGDLVRLIGTDGYMPPLGSIGVVLSDWDPDGDDYEVHFPSHPCPNPPGTFWYACRTWLKRIPPSELLALEHEELVA